MGAPTHDVNGTDAGAAPAVGSEASKDMVLYSEFQSMDDLKAYAGHPEHLKVVEFVKPLVCERHVVDYEV